MRLLLVVRRGLTPSISLNIGAVFGYQPRWQALTVRQRTAKGSDGIAGQGAQLDMVFHYRQFQESSRLDSELAAHIGGDDYLAFS